jgi:hypothetical protein
VTLAADEARRRQAAKAHEEDHQIGMFESIGVDYRDGTRRRMTNK